MMEDLKKRWLPRILTGGCAGIAAHVLLGYLLGCFSLFGPASFSGFRFPDCGFPYEIEWVGILVSFILFALFGAEVGVATIPFAGSGRELAARSLLHFAVTSATVAVWAVLNFGWHETQPSFLIPLTLVYLLVWLGRWVGWFAEVAAIREKLGLAPGPSLFHWKESLPYVGFALLLCLALPTLLRFADAADVPVLSVMYAFLLLPVGGFMSGLSLGRRHGFCPLYPVACAVFTGAFILSRYPIDGGILFAIAVLSVLAGNAAGAVRHKMKQKKEEA